MALQVASLGPPHRGARPQIEEGDIGDAAVPLPRLAPRVTPRAAVVVAPKPPVDNGPRRWAVQIGAFADQGQAQTQLAVYAERSMDVVGQARRIVTPFNSADGRKLYRARSAASPKARRAKCAGGRPTGACPPSPRGPPTPPPPYLKIGRGAPNRGRFWGSVHGGNLANAESTGRRYATRRSKENHRVHHSRRHFGRAHHARVHRGQRLSRPEGRA